MGKELIKIIKSIVEQLLDIVYPDNDVCISCFKEGYVGICNECLSKIKRVDSKDGIISYGYYGGVLKKLILAFKYEKNFLAGKILGEFICKLIEENSMEIDMIVYVPITKRAMKKRGFNQCRIISEEVSKRLSIPVSHNLIKIRETKEQKSLTKDERAKNLYEVFDVKDKKMFINKKILLIDDVITTGATMRECEKVLKKYGASTIKILTVAKSDI